MFSPFSQDMIKYLRFSCLSFKKIYIVLLPRLLPRISTSFQNDRQNILIHSRLMIMNNAAFIASIELKKSENLYENKVRFVRDDMEMVKFSDNA